jgi:APA family basic amino acid/polyamine antiporter
VPLSDAERYMLEGKEGILEAMMALGPMFTVGTTLRYCRNIARGILSAVSDKKIDMLIMGWHGGKGGRVFSLGSTIDPVVERAPCNVVILKGCGGNQEFRRILVPVAGGPNGAFALEVASILVDKDEGEIVALTVARPGGSFDLDGFVDACQGRLQVPRRRVTTRAVEASDVVQAILGEAGGPEGYDMVVLGYTREPVLRRVGRDSVPEAVARVCTKPLVMVKASGGIRTWLKRWI